MSFSLLNNNSYRLNEARQQSSIFYDLELKNNSDLFGPNVTHQLDSELLLSPHMICEQICPYLLILIPSLPANFKKRMTIRNTFGSLSKDRVSEINGIYIKQTVRVVFILGTKGRDINTSKTEFAQHKDIIQYDFEESYSKLTFKMLLGFKWIAQFCSKFKYVSKVDEDTFLNVALLLQALETYSNKSEETVYGRLYRHRLVLRGGRWMVPKTTFPRPFYPNYLSGTAYTLTSSLIPKIVELAKLYRFPLEQVEDAFITGILAAETLGAKLIGLRGSSTWGEPYVSACQFVESRRISFSVMSPRVQTYNDKVWEALKNFKRKCGQWMKKNTHT